MPKILKQEESDCAKRKQNRVSTVDAKKYERMYWIKGIATDVNEGKRSDTSDRFLKIDKR